MANDEDVWVERRTDGWYIVGGSQEEGPYGDDPQFVEQLPPQLDPKVPGTTEIKRQSERWRAGSHTINIGRIYHRSPGQEAWEYITSNFEGTSTLRHEYRYGGATPLQEDVRVVRRGGDWFITCGGETKGPYKGQPEFVRQTEVETGFVESGPMKTCMPNTFETWVAEGREIVIVHTYDRDDTGSKKYVASRFLEETADA
jgi:hypothetical protein